MLPNIAQSDWLHLRHTRQRSASIITMRHMLIRQLWTYAFALALIFGVVAVLLSLDLWLAVPVVVLSAAVALVGTAIILLRTRGTQLADEEFKIY
jgi:hypothetical protein